MRFVEKLTVAVEETSGSSSEEDVYKITMSEPESLSTSDDEDSQLLEMALGSAYTCSPSLFRKSSVAALDPAERTSLLFLDKDFIGNEGLSFSLSHLLCVIIT